MTEIVYSHGRHGLQEGQVYQNPRFFTGPIKEATKVIIDGDHPNIVAAYRDAGVPVEIVGYVEKPIVPATFLCGSDDEIPVIPKNWRDLAWPELRELAKQCGARFAINRREAVAAIEAQIARSGGVETSA